MFRDSPKYIQIYIKYIQLGILKSIKVIVKFLLYLHRGFH